MIATESQEIELIRSVLVGLGSPNREASIQAALLVAADLRAHPSHGLQRLPVLAGRLKAGLIRPATHGKAHWITESVLTVDGERGFGPVVALDAIELIAERARRTGISMAAVHNSNHIGMLGFYVDLIAKGGQIGLALTAGEALVHPWGGSKPMLGANPIAIGIPAGPHPFVIDMATSIVSMGQVLEYLWRAEPLPEGWALDAGGNPTQDPRAASGGSLAPFGGFKGYALGLAIGLIVSAVTGAAIGPDVKGTLDISEVCNKGDVFICIDLPPTDADPDLPARLSQYLASVRDTPTQAGRPAVSIPGDRSRAIRDERLENGIPVIDSVWDACVALKQSPRS